MTNDKYHDNENQNNPQQGNTKIDCDEVEGVGQTISHPFDRLTPDTLMSAIESLDLICDGRMLALNSYENRVYQIGLDEEQPIIAKFYRPNRWTNEQIREEHEFTQQLAHAELPVIAPLTFHGDSLFEYQDFRFSLYPRQGGHAPELDNLDHLQMMGRFMGRIHAVGACDHFKYRQTLHLDTVRANADYLLANFIPGELCEAYESITADLLKKIDQTLNSQHELSLIRTHGDCHCGNVLWRSDTPHFVDFDDCCMAPAIQDIWMLLSGQRAMQTMQLSEITDGYNEFFDFPIRQLPLIEPLRTMRIINYSAWLARRWDDPAFPRNFPWFNDMRYWGEHILELREQQAALNEPPLTIV